MWGTVDKRASAGMGSNRNEKLPLPAASHERPKQQHSHMCTMYCTSGGEEEKAFVGSSLSLFPLGAVLVLEEERGGGDMRQLAGAAWKNGRRSPAAFAVLGCF